MRFDGHVVLVTGAAKGILNLPSSRPSRRFFPRCASGPSLATGLPAFAITNSWPSCARSRSREKWPLCVCPRGGGERERVLRVLRGPLRPARSHSCADRGSSALHNYGEQP
jgi:hypothetical protein